jgi:hypothetical protein
LPPEAFRHAILIQFPAAAEIEVWAWTGRAVAYAASPRAVYNCPAFDKNREAAREATSSSSQGGAPGAGLSMPERVAGREKIDAIG